MLIKQFDFDYYFRSACVYSRKVEYLYQLVFRVLDIVADRNTNEEQHKKDGDPELNFCSEPQFISLDDIIEAKSSAIDLVERDAHADSSAIAQVQSPLLLTMSLDADMDDSSDPNKDFRLASASIHSSGALLLDARFASYLDGNVARRSTWGLEGSVERVRSGDQSPALSLIAQNSKFNANENCSPSMDVIPEFQAEEDCHDESDDSDPFPQTNKSYIRPSNPPEANANRVQLPTDALTSCAQNRNDVWAMLNPHEDTSSRERPFRKGKTYRKPCIAANSEAKDIKLCCTQLSIRSHQARSLRLPYFADFSSHFIQERNRKLAQKLADARAQSVSMSCDTMHQLGMMLNLDSAVSCQPVKSLLSPELTSNAG